MSVGHKARSILAMRFGKQKWSIAGAFSRHCVTYTLAHLIEIGTTNNPKIISKCFHCVHMWLRNYSVNIWEKLMVVSFIVLRIVEIQPETHQYIFLGQSPKFLDCSCLLFQSTFHSGPRDHSSSKKYSFLTPVKPLAEAFAITLQKNMDTCALLCCCCCC